MVWFPRLFRRQPISEESTNVNVMHFPSHPHLICAPLLFLSKPAISHPQHLSAAKSLKGLISKKDAPGLCYQELFNSAFATCLIICIRPHSRDSCTHTCSPGAESCSHFISTSEALIKYKCVVAKAGDGDGVRCCVFVFQH